MEKSVCLKERLQKYGKVAVAFSGGVDSSFLLKAAVEALGKENVLAVTVRSSVNPEEEIFEAEAFLKLLDLEYRILDFNVFDIQGFKENPTDRCYICKTQIFENVIAVAAEKGIFTVVDGTNADDEGDYRPGMKALMELGVKSPLKECGLGKEEIRQLSKQMGLDTWNKPSLACLASRIPYGEEITQEKLKRVELAETYLRKLGLTQLRVRCHGNVARIELLPQEMKYLYSVEKMAEVNEKLKALGFKYVTVDLAGFRSGSMNEVLNR